MKLRTNNVEIRKHFLLIKVPFVNLGWKRKGSKEAKIQEKVDTFFTEYFEQHPLSKLEKQELRKQYLNTC